MASYSQWAKGRSVRRLTWVCGPEQVLAEDIVRHYRSKCDEQVVMVAGTDSERDVWAACSQPPGDPDVSRLVLVRSAQRLRAWDEIDSLIAARDLASVLVIWHSDDDGFAMVRSDEGQVLAPYLAALRDSRAGQIVRCAVPDAAMGLPDWVVTWASEVLGGAGPVLGAHLLAAAGDDLPEAANIAAKLRAACIDVTRESISALADPGADYAESVLNGRKQDALAAAPFLGRDELRDVIFLLSSRLDTLSLLHQASVKKLNAREIAVKMGVSQYLQQRYKTLARSYGPQRVSSCRSVLAVADDARLQGISDGIAEVIAVLWGS